MQVLEEEQVMYKYEIACDLDGVLCLTPQKILSAAQSRGLLLNKTIDDWKSYRLEEAFPEEITYEQVKEIFRTKGFWESIEPCPYLQVGVRELYDNGVEIHIVTARTANNFYGDLVKTTRWWLWIHGIPYNKLSFVSAVGKPLYCKENELDFIIDDYASTCLEVCKVSLAHSYIVAAAYNTLTEPFHSNIRREDAPFYERIFTEHYEIKT